MNERWLSILVAGLGGCTVLAVLVTQAGPRDVGRAPVAEALMLELVNEARNEHDLLPLATSADVADVAWTWSTIMAEHRALDHNPHHADEICCWSVVTENVAFSDPMRIWLPGDPVERITRQLHEALLESPGHRANILDPQVDQIGLGIHVHRDGSVWITQNFRRYAPT